jgi:hypothetical protein
MQMRPSLLYYFTLSGEYYFTLTILLVKGRLECATQWVNQTNLYLSNCTRLPFKWQLMCPDASPRNFDKSLAAKNCRRYFEVRRQFFVTINWHLTENRIILYLVFSWLYSRKPCFTHNNIETSYQSFSFNFVTLYGRCSKIVCMFKLEFTWSISELSMYFKISHKNKAPPIKVFTKE